MNIDSSRPNLPEVTLVAATSVAIEATIAALEASMRQVNFAEVLLLSDQPPPRQADKIRWHRIRKLNSRADYSHFMLRRLADYVATSHVLCVQWDGFVLDGKAWDPSFLGYDYIGSVWPHFHDGYNVGNGGFSLRSTRLLQACKRLPYHGCEAEDVLIGRVCRRRLEELGIRFAPEELARRFAYERTRPSGHEFGFHGVFNLVRLGPPAEMLTLFGTLEAQVLTEREHRELFWSAISRGRARLALILLRRLLHRRRSQNAC